MAHSPPPLTGIRVLELAGLAPGPFAGMMLADYGATVIRVDRAHPSSRHADPTSSSSSSSAPPAALPPPPPTADLLTRRKTSIAIDLKSAGGRALLLALLPAFDVLIDPFRPGVLEKAGLDPTRVLRRRNPRLVVARLTGFRPERREQQRRDEEKGEKEGESSKAAQQDRYANMAGHDINYLAVSGVLGMLGRKAGKPYAPGNVLADFAGGGAMAAFGVVLALLERERNGGWGQVVEANMVDGSAYLASFLRLGMGKVRVPVAKAKAAADGSTAGEVMEEREGVWGRARGENLLDGGCPWYDTYETKDGRWVAVGALEERFFEKLCEGLGVEPAKFPGPREDRRVWPHLRMLFTAKFKSKTREEWERVFDGTDACVTPVLEQQELRQLGFDQRPPVTLRSSPGLAIADGEPDTRPAAEGQGIGVEGEGWEEKGLAPGEGGEEMLARLMGWTKGRHYAVENGGLVLIERTRSSKSKL
ncbi:alpha-methylacyl-racemase [Diplodia corticola]|uniref:Alpha-methylacyl-racemase n=1 Tax=Diplodia corticola TaxID=236234 RepID=A0A1J9S020_9PEZI|nr:alpha-methylacyl-racemase [Diplodia corticola]OJD33372.1 alpha-methylacyl-racemase [Diplodia corticola]